MIILLMTPREASMLEGQILDPGDWPWQDSEALMIAQEAKTYLNEAVKGVSARELDASLVAVMAAQKAHEQEEEQAATELVLGEAVSNGIHPRMAPSQQQPPPQEDDSNGN